LPSSINSKAKMRSTSKD